MADCQIVIAHCPSCGSTERPDVVTKNGCTSCCGTPIAYDLRTCPGGHPNPERQLTKFTCGHIIAVCMLENRSYCFYCGPTERTLFTDAPPVVEPKPKPKPAVTPSVTEDHGLGKMSRARCLELLAAAGYTGPTSYNMEKLRSIVASHTN